MRPTSKTTICENFVVMNNPGWGHQGRPDRVSVVGQKEQRPVEAGRPLGRLHRSRRRGVREARVPSGSARGRSRVVSDYFPNSSPPALDTISVLQFIRMKARGSSRCARRLSAPAIARSARAAGQCLGEPRLRRLQEQTLDRQPRAEGQQHGRWAVAAPQRLVQHEQDGGRRHIAEPA